MPDELTYTRLGNEWLFSDGTRLPVVTGGDGEEIVDEAPSEVDTTAPESAPAEAPPEVDYESEAPPEGFTPERMWKEIRDRRKSEGDYRMAYKPFKEAFDGLDDNDRTAFLHLVATYKADPAAAGQWMAENAKALTPAERGDIAEAAGLTETDAPLTETRFNQLMSEREQQEGVRRATEEMQREARDLGYDTEGPEYLMLIQFMNRLSTTDVAAGHAEVEKWKQSIRDGFVSGKKNEAENAKKVVTDGGPAASKVEIKGLDDADKAAREYLSNL